MAVATATPEAQRCAKCGHARALHPRDGLCRVKECGCFFYKGGAP